MVIGSHHFRTDIEQDQLSMTSLANRIAIIGAGQAGSSVDAVKRSSGSGGAAWLLGAEPAPNRQRPLLSNAFLKDEIGAALLRATRRLPGMEATDVDKAGQDLKPTTNDRKAPMTNTFRLHVTGRDGKSRESDGRIGGSLLEILRDAGVEEISAMCGGNCSCATCHVYVEAEGLLPEPCIDESEMLDTLLQQTPLSRLACQVTIAAGIDCLRVEVAPEE